MNNLVVLDVECYPNYFLIAVKSLEKGKLLTMEISGKDTSFTKEQGERVLNVLRKFTTFGYNSLNYDMPLITCAIGGASCKELYTLSKNIIENRQPNWMTYRNIGIEPLQVDHFDIMEPSPAVMISLKNYGTRVGSKKLWDLPFDPHQSLSQDEMVIIKDYCENDLDVTIDLYNAIADRINLRVTMASQYGVDLRSKSDAQIAETVIVSELEKQSISVSKPTLKSNYTTKYKAPDFIQFDTKDLQDLLSEVQKITFGLQANGSVKMPKELANRKIIIGKTTYKMGIGGLHSQEKSISVTSNKYSVMRNADFTSYYPFIILNLGLYPKHLGKGFLDIYRNIVETRLKAKAEGNKLVADSLKITINGSFGKFGSKYSKLYSPDLLLATTITGQLSLLMLIEQMEKNNIPVVSANTDGLEYFCPRDKIELAESLVFDLELVSGFEMEHGEYESLHAKDVNNYVAVYDGYVKSKGLYAETSLSKGRSTPIVYEAIRKFLLDGTSIKKTITDCTDMNEFVSARSVKGGATYKGKYVGKVVRWYYSMEGDSLHYAGNGNLVPKTGMTTFGWYGKYHELMGTFDTIQEAKAYSGVHLVKIKDSLDNGTVAANGGYWKYLHTDGVKPMMDLTEDIPDDLDYLWYYNEANNKLEDLGVAIC